MGSYKMPAEPLPADRQALVLRHLGLVGWYVKRYRLPAAADYDDYRQEGRLGLIRAAMSFRGDKKVKFVTYAAACIRSALYDYRVRNARNVTGGHPTKRLRAHDASLDAPLHPGTTETRMDSLEDSGPSALEVAAAHEREEAVRAAMRGVFSGVRRGNFKPDARTRDIGEALLRRDVPLSDANGEVARTFGVSRQRIEQVRKIAARVLRARLHHYHEETKP